jgi:outer membrane protein OmpA-like peptidoglycan-associated protein
LSGLYKLPINYRLSPFVKLGVSAYTASGNNLGTLVDEENRAGINLGIGAELALTDNVAVRGVYNIVDMSDAHYFGAGVQYYFNKDRPQPVKKVAPVKRPKPEPMQQLVRLAKNIFFVTNKDELTPQSRRVLDQAADILNKYKSLEINIYAHTDSVGSDQYNARLSQKRAYSTMKYLIHRGVNPLRMSAMGFGERKPIATNETVSGRAQNRRVEIRSRSAVQR